jgi:hypothetical protein
VPAIYSQSLARAVLNTVTDGDDKDHDLRMGHRHHLGWPIAVGQHQEWGLRWGQHHSHYDNHSTHDIAFQIDAPGAKREACKGFKVRLWQKTHGGAGPLHHLPPLVLREG